MARRRWAAGLWKAAGVVVVVAVTVWALRLPKPEQCLVADLAARLDRTHLLVGGAMEGATFMSLPFDLRYHYVAGGVPDAPCDDCRACTVDGLTCANPTECGWWGCWQRDDVPPGAFVDRFVEDAERHGAVPMFTWYQWFYVAGRVEEHAEIEALADPARVGRYVDDYGRFVRRVGEQATGPVIVHLEPDLWAFARKSEADPTKIRVALGDAPDCRGLPEDLRGLAQCLARTARHAIPEVVVGLHASSWDADADALLDTREEFDVEAHGRATARWLAGLGADPDLLVVETNHRDAGFNGVWWDADERTRPHFGQARAWARALSREAGLPHLWWQVPYGHPGLSDTCGSYRDNRLDAFFDHPDRFADGTTLGIAFGAGEACMTVPESDGGHFLARAAGWFAGPRALLCGT